MFCSHVHYNALIKNEYYQLKCLIDCGLYVWEHFNYRWIITKILHQLLFRPVWHMSPKFHGPLEVEPMKGDLAPPKTIEIAYCYNFNALTPS